MTVGISMGQEICLIIARTVSMGRPVVNPMRSNQNLRGIFEASESTRLRMGESLPSHHEDHIAGKGENSLPALQFGSQIYSNASSHENSCSKSSSGQGNGKNWKRFRRGT